MLDRIRKQRAADKCELEKTESRMRDMASEVEGMKAALGEMEGSINDLKKTFKEQMGSMERSMADVLDAIASLKNRPGAPDNYDPKLNWGADATAR